MDWCLKRDFESKGFFSGTPTCQPRNLMQTSRLLHRQVGILAQGHFWVAASTQPYPQSCLFLILFCTKKGFCGGGGGGRGDGGRVFGKGLVEEERGNREEKSHGWGKETALDLYTIRWRMRWV